MVRLMSAKAERKARKSQLSSFAWIFSIIVGAVFFFLAFFFVTQYGKKTAEPQREAIVESGISVLVEPFSAIGSLVEAQGSVLEFPPETYVEFGCNVDGDYSEIKARSTKERTFSLIKKAYDKYIFSSAITTKGKENYFAFSMPLKEPFYIATPVIIVTNNYCFVGLPYEMEEELKAISEKINLTKYRFNFTQTSGECPTGYITVCEKGCNVQIQFLCGGKCGFVGNKFWWGDLVYPAIFADETVYQCNLERILERMKTLADIYLNKTTMLEGCNPDDISTRLKDLKNAVETFKKYKNGNTLVSLYNQITALEAANEALPKECKVF
jgi:hypothetical protein